MYGQSADAQDSDERQRQAAAWATMPTGGDKSVDSDSYSESGRRCPPATGPPPEDTPAPARPKQTDLRPYPSQEALSESSKHRRCRNRRLCDAIRVRRRYPSQTSTGDAAACASGAGVVRVGCQEGARIEGDRSPAEAKERHPA